MYLPSLLQAGTLLVESLLLNAEVNQKYTAQRILRKIYHLNKTSLLHAADFYNAQLNCIKSEKEDGDWIASDLQAYNRDSSAQSKDCRSQNTFHGLLIQNGRTSFGYRCQNIARMSAKWYMMCVKRWCGSCSAKRTYKRLLNGKK